jgi:hypothetical protein
MKILLLGVMTYCTALAESVVLTLNQPLQITSPGSFLAFSGRIWNTGSATVYLNGADLTLPYFELNSDLTLFFTLSPPSVASNESYNGDFFTIAVSGAALPGDYFGALTIQGGADLTFLDDLAGQSFQITVAEQSAVPEPSTLQLLATAIGLIGGCVGLRRWAKHPNRTTTMMDV